MNEEFVQLLERLRTPRKLGQLVLAPSWKEGSYDSHAVDCPFPFEHNSQYYMTPVGWDGIGYRTGLASSDDLIHWKKEGIILDRGPKGSVTEFNAVLTWIVRDNDLFGSGQLKKIDGKFLGTYHAYPGAGYENGPAKIGLCRSDDLLHWDLEEPFLYASDGASWENGGLYKSCLVEHGGTYFMFYNARNLIPGPWQEQTGMVVSTDLRSWKRFEGNPVLTVGASGSFDDRFASDPTVLKHKDTWVMFYYSMELSDRRARNSVAFSKDLFRWEKSNEVLIDVGPEGSIDSRYAHKPGILTKDGVLYHFYCAVSPSPGKYVGTIEPFHSEIRGISVALS